MQDKRLAIAMTWVGIATLMVVAGSPSAAAADMWELSASADADSVAWEIELSEATLADPAAVEQRLPSILRGSADPADTPPLTLHVDFDQPMVVGFYVEQASPFNRAQAGAVFEIHLNGERYHRKTWPWAGTADGTVETLFYLPVPEGESTVTLEVTGGYSASTVRISRYYVAAEAGDLPDDAVALADDAHPSLENTRVDGYRGIWYAHEQVTEFGDKYSGGLGTYTAKHIPLAMYVEEVDKTFFVYGGTVPVRTVTLGGEWVERQHVSMIGAFDHATGEVSRPTVVHETRGANDPHFNPTLAVDAAGHLLLYVSGRAAGRPGHVYRGVEPYSIAAFERVHSGTINYGQPWLMPDESLMLILTRYTAGRAIYWQHSADGRGDAWTDPQPLLRMGGHYVMSRPHGSTLGVAGNYHVGGHPDRRTNLYYLQTSDNGATWTTIDGVELETPLTEPENAARIVDYESEGLFVYLMDMAFDEKGRPVLLYLTSHGHEPGPPNDPRTWRVTRWDGEQWQTHAITTSDHNYDTGSLNLEGDTWRVIGPSATGPQPFQTGGELESWTSTDQGRTWERERRLTDDSAYNHGYVRRPVDARGDFYGYWADGDPTGLSPSRLYIIDRAGQVYRLPTQMDSDWMKPERLPSVER